jgi:hypothetical protein
MEFFKKIHPVSKSAPQAAWAGQLPSSSRTIAWAGQASMHIPSVMQFIGRTTLAVPSITAKTLGPSLRHKTTQCVHPMHSSGFIAGLGFSPFSNIAFMTLHASMRKNKYLRKNKSKRKSKKINLGL